MRFSHLKHVSALEQVPNSICSCLTHMYRKMGTDLLQVAWSPCAGPLNPNPSPFSATLFQEETASCLFRTSFSSLVPGIFFPLSWPFLGALLGSAPASSPSPVEPYHEWCRKGQLLAGSLMVLLSGSSSSTRPAYEGSKAGKMEACQWLELKAKEEGASLSARAAISRNLGKSFDRTARAAWKKKMMRSKAPRDKRRKKRLPSCHQLAWQSETRGSTG